MSSTSAPPERICPRHARSPRVNAGASATRDERALAHGGARVALRWRKRVRHLRTYWSALSASRLTWRISNWHTTCLAVLSMHRNRSRGAIGIFAAFVALSGCEDSPEEIAQARLAAVAEHEAKLAPTLDALTDARSLILGDRYATEPPKGLSKEARELLADMFKTMTTKSLPSWGKQASGSSDSESPNCSLMHSTRKVAGLLSRN